MEKNNQTVLAVLAHPDDETIFNGTLAMLAENNANVYLIYATSGDGGHDATGQNLHGKELAKVREIELQKALETLNISNPPFFLRFDDGKLSENVDVLQEKILKIFEAVKPDTIITFGPEGFTGHIDHKTLNFIADKIFNYTNFDGNLLHVAVSEERNKIYKNLFKGLVVENLVSDKKIDFKVDVSKYAQQRKESVLAHRTQFPDDACEIWNKFVDVAPYEEFLAAHSKSNVFICIENMKNS